LTEILNYLRNNRGRRVPEIAEHINKSISIVERYLKSLRDNDLIGFNGAPKTGGYIIFNNRNSLLL
jgi:ATP-dependent DNA helicase RecG